MDAVHLHSAGHQGALAYSKPLPRSLHFAMGRAEAHKLLGLPAQSGGATMDSILGRMSAWDVFIDRGHKVHLQYTLSEDAIQMVTLSKAN